MNRIKTGDNVIVIAGKSKGHIAKVVQVKDSYVFVKDANLVKKHIKPNPQKQITGGVITREAGIHVSNVAHYNPNTKKADRIGFRYMKDGDVNKKVRYYKSDNELVEAS